MLKVCKLRLEQDQDDDDFVLALTLALLALALAVLKRRRRFHSSTWSSFRLIFGPMTNGSARGPNRGQTTDVSRID